MRKLLLTLHLYLALAAGAFILILGLTGTIMAFEPELDHLMHWRLSYVTPGNHTLSLSELSAIILQKFPGEHIDAYLLAASPNLSYQVAIQRGLLYINPYSGEVLGVRPPGMDFLGYVHQLHLRLLLRDKADTGGKIMSWTAVVILFLLLSGLYLWWPAKRASVKWGASSRRVWFDLHNTIGVFSVLFLLVLTITGVMIGFERTTVPLLYKMTGSRPSARPPMPPPPPPGALQISPDQAVAIARTAIPGATPFAIFMNPGAPVIQVASRFPEDRTPGGRSRTIIDAYTGKILFAEGSRTAPAGARLVILNRAIHTGDIWGIPSKFIMSLACFLMVWQVISGVAMWWTRTRNKRLHRQREQRTAA